MSFLLDLHKAQRLSYDLRPLLLVTICSHFTWITGDFWSSCIHSSSDGAIISTVLNVLHSFRVLEPGWGPGGFDAGPVLETIVVSCHIGVACLTLWARQRGSRRETKQSASQLLFFILSNGLKSIFRPSSQHTSSRRHRRRWERWTHPPERSSSLPCNHHPPVKQSKVKNAHELRNHAEVGRQYSHGGR